MEVRLRNFLRLNKGGDKLGEREKVKEQPSDVHHGIGTALCSPLFWPSLARAASFPAPSATRPGPWRAPPCSPWKDTARGLHIHPRRNQPVYIALGYRMRNPVLSSQQGRRRQPHYPAGRWEATFLGRL